MDTPMPSSHKDPRFIIKLVGMLLVAGIVIIAIIRDRIVQNQQWQVSVVGRGTVEYQPDLATITMGVQIERAGTAASAINQLNQQMQKVVAAVQNAGVAQDAIQTNAYSLYPVYDYVPERSILIGYGANQLLNVKITDLPANQELLTKVVEEATKAGVNQINGITFDVKNVDELKQQARIEAIGEARASANRVASAAGVRLKRVVGWWENFVQLPGGDQFYMDGKGGGGGAVTSPVIPTGKQEIVVEMSLNYLVK